ncbi:MAG: hypothetical protein Q4A65_05625 [Bacillota bacterium]|nr:hypothetical protein [Bacillota bacterium]
MGKEYVTKASAELYEVMLGKGYPQEFAAIVANELHTEFTANRMIGYLNKFDKLPLEEVADEMLAIISDRDRIAQKHILEHSQSKINEMYRDQYDNPEEP